MPYFKVPVSIMLNDHRYVEAEDKDAAITKVADQCDNTVPHISNWSDSDEAQIEEDLDQIEEISFEEYENHQDDVF